MQKKRHAKSGFLIPRSMLACALIGAGTFCTWLAFAGPAPVRADAARRVEPVRKPVPQAPTPASGTISAGSPTLSYSDGPFVIPNATAQAGAPICTVPMSCSDFTLTVAANDPTKQVRVSVAWPITTADFDVYVYSDPPTNTMLAGTSASSADPEVVILPASNATYTIKVVPFAPAGQTYTTTVTLENKPAVPVAGSAPAPRYQNYPPLPADLPGAGSAGEPSVGVDWNPNVASLVNITPNTAGTPPMNGLRLNAAGVAFFTANLNEYRVNFDDCSSPAGNLWQDATNATESIQTLDPIGFVDHQLPGETGPASNGAGLGRVFQSQLAGATSIASFSDDDGNTYTQSQGSGQPAGVDHQTFGGGPYAPTNTNSVPPVIEPTHTYPHQIYYASQDIGTALAARSDTGGLTFGPGVPMYTINQCGGLHGHVKVGPDGTVYVPNKSCGSNSGVAVSRDNGVTWAVKLIPGSTPGSTDPSVGIGADNTLYIGYQNGDGHPHIAVSTNHGDTFHDVDVSQGVIAHAVFPEVVAGDGDRAAFGFLGTSESAGSPDDINGFRGVWYYYIATTLDRGQTYTLVNASGTDPVQVGSVCTAGTTCGADRNLLDFADLQLDKEGRVLLAYADGCLAPTCTAASATAHGPPYNESRAALASILRQSGGPRLLSAFDSQANCGGSPLVCTSTVPGAPRVDQVFRSGVNVHLAWSQPDNGGQAISAYHVFRKSGAAGSYSVIATVTGKTSYDDTTATDLSIAYTYKVSAVNSVGESPTCGEFPIGQAATQESACLPPGLTILTDPTGDELDMLPSHDAQSLRVSEGFAYAPDKIVFTLKMQDLATVPPNSRWPIVFDYNGTNYTVRMTTSPTDGSTGTPIFQAGPTAGTLVAADPSSNYTADGTITIVVPRSIIGNPAVGQNLTGFLVRIVAVNGIVITGTFDNMPDSLAPTGTYTVVGNASCVANRAPVAVLAGNPPAGDPPLAVHFDASGSTDPDSGDSVASYTFDFGDGTAPVTQASSMIDHTYTSNGNFRATVKVTDSRGSASGNVGQQVVEVDLPLDDVVSRKTHGTSGDFDIDLLRGDGTADVECRSEGTGYRVIFTFGMEYTVTGNASTMPTASNGATVSSHGPGPGSNQYTVTITSVTNAQHHLVTLNGVPVTNGSKGNAAATLNNAGASFDLLVGDVNATRRVDGGDVLITRQQNLQTLSISNFRADVNASGRIDGGDVLLTRNQNLTALP